MNTVMVTRIGNAAARLVEGLIDQPEYFPGLALEVAAQVAALAVLERGLAGEPDDASALGDDARREGALLLSFVLFHVVGRHGMGGKAGGEGGRQNQS
jgi:hypothetical protein